MAKNKGLVIQDENWLNVHEVYHKFCKRFQDSDGKFKKHGYPLMAAIERWALDYPKQVFIVTCDDMVHSTSELIIIEHSSKTSYMGATVIFVPQCTGEYPIQFFLYPHSRKNLIKVLKGLGKRKI